MMKYNPRKRKISILIIAITVAILLFFILNIFSHQVRNVFYVTSAPLQKILWRAGKSSFNFLSPFFIVHKLKNENNNLTLQNNQILTQVLFLEGIEAENQVLRDALSLTLQKDYKLILAEIISKDDDKDYILINKGSADGVSQGMPIITGQKVLFGKIFEVYKNFSRVAMISEKGFVSDIKIKDKDIYGVVRGDGNLNIYLDLIPRDTAIANGDIILTSSLEGNFPKDLLVGTITKIIKEDTKAFQTAELKPFFNINSSDSLFIITNFKN